jgi:hypothetical protein
MESIMRVMLLIMAILSIAASQNTFPPKHAESRHPQTESKDSASANKPQIQIVLVEVAGDSRTAKAPTSDQRPQRWWNRPTITDWILTGTTLVYALVNIFMWIAIKAQSTAMMDANCALILILWDNMVHIDPDVPNGELHHCFQWTFKNGGETPAFIQQVHSRFIVVDKLSDLPLTPVYLKAKEMSYNSEPLMPDEKFKPEIYTPIESELPFEELDTALRNKKRFLYAYGFVTYLDVYGRPQETRFGIAYESSARPSLESDRFRIEGPKAYNRYKLKR